ARPARVAQATPRRDVRVSAPGDGDSTKLRQRVVDAATATLAEQNDVSIVDIVRRLGWIHPTNIEAWQRTRISDLEWVLPVPAERLILAAELLSEGARGLGLAPVNIGYTGSTRDRRELTSLASGREEAERGLRIHWLPPDESPATSASVVERQPAAAELVVFLPRRDWTSSPGGAGTPRAQ